MIKLIFLDIDDFNSSYIKENYIQTSYYDENKMLSSEDDNKAIKKYDIILL